MDNILDEVVICEVPCDLKMALLVALTVLGHQGNGKEGETIIKRSLST